MARAIELQRKVPYCSSNRMSPTESTTNDVQQVVAGSSPATQPPTSAEKPVIPIFEVAFPKGMWWSIPAEMSKALYQKYTNNEDACYTWDWGDTRSGAWRPDGDQCALLIQSRLGRSPAKQGTIAAQREPTLPASRTGE